jgi:hypothetical protein
MTWIPFNSDIHVEPNEGVLEQRQQIVLVSKVFLCQRPPLNNKRHYIHVCAWEVVLMSKTLEEALENGSSRGVLARGSSGGGPREILKRIGVNIHTSH